MSEKPKHCLRNQLDGHDYWLDDGEGNKELWHFDHDAQYCAQQLGKCAISTEQFAVAAHA